MEQTILNLCVAFFELLGCEWNLCKIILTLVRIVGCGVKTRLLFLGFLFNGSYGVALFLGKLSLLRFLVGKIAYI